MGIQVTKEDEGAQIEGQMVETEADDGCGAGCGAQHSAYGKRPENAPFDVAYPQEYAAAVGGQLHRAVNGDDGGGRQQAGHGRDQQDAAAHADDAVSVEVKKAMPTRT